MIRSVLASEWTAAALVSAHLLVHVWWFAISEHQGDVVSGFGGTLSALGIYVATQPYIRKGIDETAKEQAGLDPAERHEKAAARQSEAEDEARHHVVKERVAGVILIALGFLLNGYGPTIAHVFALRGS